MRDWRNAIEQFFDELRLYEDETKGTHHRLSIQEAVKAFLCEHEKSAPAMEVYRLFFQAYWMGIEKERNPFLQLVESLKDFEATAGKVLPKHRDHFEHVVNVFLLGLAIYVVNPRFQACFSNYLAHLQYRDSYELPHEEFFYRWGLATLFHDIAYPIELTLKQAKSYVKLLTSYVCEGADNDKVLLNIPGLDQLHSVPRLMPKVCYQERFCAKYPALGARPFDDRSEALLGIYIAERLELSPNEVMKGLEKLKSAISVEGMVDHGYYGAVTLMKWSHRLMQQGEWNPAYFYYPVLDSASAILLHNWYKFGLQGGKFALGSLKCELHPVAWLLILCDELQEWGRVEHRAGKESLVPVPDATILVGDGLLKVYYDAISQDTVSDLIAKEEAIGKVIDLLGDIRLRISAVVKNERRE